MSSRVISWKSTCGPFIFLLSLTAWILIPPAPIRPETLPVVPTTPPSLVTCSPYAPVTNECVEAGLRKRREVLRAQPAFQVKTSAIHLQLAEHLNQQGDPNGAIEEYRAAIQLDPSHASAFLGLGAVYLDQHEWRQAEGALERAARFDSKNSQTQYWLGRSRLAQHKFHEAQRAFTTATKLNPEDAEAYSDLGLAYMAQGQSREAINALRHAIRVRPDFSEAHSRLELAEALKLNQGLLVQETATIVHLLFGRE